MRVRVLTYNVHSFRGGVEAVADVVGPEEPDVLLLQECGSRRALRRFAQAVQMQAESSHRFLSRVRNAVLLRSPWSPGAVQVGTFAREGRSRRRGFVAVQLRRTGLAFTAVSAHLGLAPREREVHARELTDFLAGLDGPIVMGADLNEDADSPAARWIGQRLFDAFVVRGTGPGPTFPARVPTVRIDFLFVTEDIRVLEARVPAPAGVALASDHRPVVADLEVEEGWTRDR